MEEEKPINYGWIEESEIEKSMDIMAERIKKISCPYCRNEISIPLIVREQDIEILKYHIEQVNGLIDKIIEYIQKTYGVDIKCTLLLETVNELKKAILEKRKVS